jgi:glycosyltransferase involved in cell wall biosynthesis
MDIEMQNIEMNKPKVSVCVVTYNQENYIGQCLQSLVDQKTDFDFEVIVSDDCSTDGTPKIIKDYASSYPRIIKATIQDKNIGGSKNYFFAHDQARGDYVAHLDGDDYALPGKLSIQAKFLDAHPECSMVFHPCKLLYQNGRLCTPKKPPIENPLNFAEYKYLYPNSARHSSKMYRRAAQATFSPADRQYLDMHMHFYHGISGLAGSVNEYLGVYRVGIGMSSNAQKLHKLALDSYDFAVELGYKKALIKKIVARRHFEYGLCALEANDRPAFQASVKLGFETGHITPSSILAYLLKKYPELYVSARNWIRSIQNRA